MTSITEEELLEEKLRDIIDKKSTKLDLNGYSMKEFPKEIFSLVNLKEIDLSGTSLSELPIEFFNLSNLETINLFGSQLHEIPSEIRKLKKLKNLILSSTYITKIPSEINELENLQYLDLSTTDLKKIPIEITHLKSLTSLILIQSNFHEIIPEIGNLKNLKLLRLAENELTEIPNELCNLKNLEELDLSINFLEFLPKDLGNLTNLKFLHLEKNNFKVIPSSIGNLKNIIKIGFSENPIEFICPELSNLNTLEEISLVDTGLKNFPSSLLNLKNIKIIDLGKNRLTNIPNEISNLKNLTELYLGRNNFKEFPQEILEIKNLNYLYLGENPIKFIPSSIEKLYQLEHLYLNETLISKLPSEIGNLKNLKVLFCPYNEIGFLPSEIGNLEKLGALDLRYNKLTSLPPEIGNLKNLVTFGVAGNSIKVLPKEIIKLTKLENFYTGGNSFFNQLPSEILEGRHPVEILNYLRMKEIENRNVSPLNQAKILFLGQGAVGKTSLIRMLIDSTFNLYEQETKGIQIKSWKQKNTDIKINVWDFGGQEIMYATHQFFLTKRSLYILVWEARKGDKINQIDYWLRIISTFGENSPIIIVMNKIDENNQELDRKGIIRKYPTNKISFVSTSCKTGIGISELRDLIIKEIEKLEHVKDLLFKNWLDVKDALEKLTEEQNFIEYDYYEKICQEKGVNKIEAKSLIKLLHDLGLVLNYSEDHRVNDTNILNPQWVTDSVYKILNSKQLFDNKGILDISKLPEILEPQIYPTNKYRFIIDLMKKFEMCYELDTIESKRILVPELLPFEEPEFDWDNKDNLILEYHYSFLPENIISRFIVKVQNFIVKCWKKGTLLDNKQNKALILSDTELNKITIKIDGKYNTKRDFLSKIEFILDEINISIKNLDIKKMIPIPEKPEVLVEIEYLRLLDEKGINEFIPPGGSDIELVKPLLDGINRIYHNINPNQNINIFGDNIKVNNMGKNYSFNNSQIGNVGDNPKIENIIFNQENNLQKTLKDNSLNEGDLKLLQSTISFLKANQLEDIKQSLVSRTISELEEYKEAIEENDLISQEKIISKWTWLNEKKIFDQVINGVNLSSSLTTIFYTALSLLKKI